MSALRWDSFLFNIYKTPAICLIHLPAGDGGSELIIQEYLRMAPSYLIALLLSPYIALTLPAHNNNNVLLIPDAEVEEGRKCNPLLINIYGQTQAERWLLHFEI